MNRIILSLLLLAGISLRLQAQLSIILNSVPSNTPAGSALYIVGNFNNWNPGDAAYALTPLGNGQYSITFNPNPGLLEFKFTRGNWTTVEGGPNGEEISNRTFTYSGQPTTTTLQVLSWKDLVGGGSTAASNVSILDADFYIPQLNRTRRIWLYLPPDYSATTSKRYPVLYMHDGQNLFDAATAFSGEWKVDESLNTLFGQGDYGCIVVGIDNGGAKRLDEYSPWVNSQYGGGEGDLYIEFIANTLKPHIDSAYRTLPQRLYTGLMGSSMGGLISMYGLIERQDVFSKAGVLSPAFWFAGNASATHVSTTGKNGDVRVYFLAGGAEPASVAQNMEAVAAAMHNAGFNTSEDTSLVVPGGQHNEAFWAKEFPGAYKWLFASGISSSPESASDAELGIFPNPAGSSFRIEGLKGGETANLKIIRPNGAVVLELQATGGEPVQTGNLPNGLYIVQIRNQRLGNRLGRLILAR